MAENLENKVIITSAAGEWFARKPEFWNEPTGFESDKDTALKMLGDIALDRKFCTAKEYYTQKAIFDNEAEATKFIKENLQNAEIGLHLAYLSEKGRWTWKKIGEKPTPIKTKAQLVLEELAKQPDYWKKCVNCGKPSDAAYSQWNEIPVCGDNCINEFYAKNS